MYILTDGNNNIVTKPYSIKQLRDSGVTLSMTPSAADLAKHNVHLAHYVSPGAVDANQKIVWGDTPTYTNGRWELTGTIVAKTAEEIAADAAAATAAQEAADAEKAAEVRAERDELIAATDWWAVQDRVMSQAEKDYRQALRDVPAQAGFPHTVTWPTKP